MEAYSGFAHVYDLLMEEVDYKGWVDYIENIFKRYQKQPKYIAELACGTGNVTNRLAQKGYHLVAVDLSEDMLMIAQEKAADMEVEVIYLNQDMRQLSLPNELDCILCVCDGINYITNEQELLGVFRETYQLLKEGGLFVFDISSYYKLSTILGNNTFAENHEKCSYIWENYFDEKRSICDFELTIFQKEGKLYRKFQENHSQRAYKQEEIVELLKKTPFKKVEAFNAFSFNQPLEESERIYFVCEK